MLAPGEPWAGVGAASFACRCDCRCGCRRAELRASSLSRPRVWRRVRAAADVLVRHQPARENGAPHRMFCVRGSQTRMTLWAGRPNSLIKLSRPYQWVAFAPESSSVRVREINSPDGGRLSNDGRSPSAFAASMISFSKFR